MQNDSDRQRAGWLLLAMGAALLVALLPFTTGLVAIPVLFVILEPAHERLARYLPPRAAAALTTALATVLIVTPAVLFGALVLGQAREIATGLADGQELARLQSLRIGRLRIGPALADLGSAGLAWLGGSALGIIGTATRQALNLVIALFGLYHLLLKPNQVWTAFTTHLPFSPATVDRLRTRFRNVTTSTVIGTGLVALIQGVLVGGALWLAGVPNALFWTLVTVVLSILPVVGSGMVWAPAAVWLFVNDRVGWAIGLTLLGLLIVGNMDFFVRPAVSRRWAHIHPVTTLVGALAGVQFFGLLGLLIGPLALSCFFELLNAYRAEYPA